MLQPRCSRVNAGIISIVVLIVAKATPIPIQFASGRSSARPLAFHRLARGRNLNVGRNPILSGGSSLLLLERLRGGSASLGDIGDEDAPVDRDVAKGDTERDNRTAPADASASSTSPTTSKEAVVVTIKASTGSKILDPYPIELPTVIRSRDVASLKTSVSRQLPSKPPVSSIQLTLHGKILDDATLVDDLIDDEDMDDEDERDDNSKGLVLQLDMIPAVDPNFIFDLDKKLVNVPLSELLEAYIINEASVLQNSALLQHEPSDTEQHHESMSAAIRKQAEKIKRDLDQTVLGTEQAQSLLRVEPSDGAAAPGSSSKQLEIKGLRVRRTALGSLTSTSEKSWKRVLQRNLNVDWGMTLRHFTLFVFFGVFGGRTATSRAILLLGAPSVFVLQARSVKLLIRQLVYAILDQPPSVLMSLLPAPQQAILSLDMRAAMKTLYGTHIVSSTSEGNDVNPLEVSSVRPLEEATPVSENEEDGGELDVEDEDDDEEDDEDDEDDDRSED